MSQSVARYRPVQPASANRAQACAGLASRALAGGRRPVTLAVMPDDEKIIAFPGSTRKEPAVPKSKAAAKSKAQNDATPELLAAEGMIADMLSEDQRKAMQLVLSGMSFVMVGIKPTASGADFFTAVHGDGEELSAAQNHLQGVIERAFARKGL